MKYVIGTLLSVLAALVITEAWSGCDHPMEPSRVIGKVHHEDYYTTEVSTSTDGNGNVSVATSQVYHPEEWIVTVRILGGDVQVPTEKENWDRLNEGGECTVESAVGRFSGVCWFRKVYPPPEQP